MPFVLHPKGHIQWELYMGTSFPKHMQITKASNLDLNFKDIGLPPG